MTKVKIRQNRISIFFEIEEETETPKIQMQDENIKPQKPILENNFFSGNKPMT